MIFMFLMIDAQEQLDGTSASFNLHVLQNMIVLLVSCFMTSQSWANQEIFNLDVDIKQKESSIIVCGGVQRKKVF